MSKCIFVALVALMCSGCGAAYSGTQSVVHNFRVKQIEVTQGVTTYDQVKAVLSSPHTDAILVTPDGAVMQELRYNLLMSMYTIEVTYNVKGQSVTFEVGKGKIAFFFENGILVHVA